MNPQKSNEDLATALSLSLWLKRLNQQLYQDALFITSMVLFGVYLGAFYYLVSVDNPFNFYNNYHAIAFLTCLTMLAETTLFVVFASKRQAGLAEGDFIKNVLQQRFELETRLPGFNWNDYFVISLLWAGMAAFPLLLHFMLMDDFVIRPRLLVPALFAIALFGQAYWRNWLRLIERQGLIRRVLFLVFFLVVSLFILDILTGLIPAPLRSGTENVIYPL